MKLFSTRIRRPWIFSVIFVGMGIVCLVVGLLSYALIETRLYLNNLKSFDPQAAQVHASRASQVVEFFSVVTFKQSNDIEGWKLALTFAEDIQSLQKLATQITQSLSGSGESLQLKTLSDPLDQLEKKISRLLEYIDSSYFLRVNLTPQQRSQLQTVATALADAQPFIESLSKDKQTWVFLLQNSDELRATGGFPGSYALLNFNNGQLEEIIIEDIYDADGQFTGFVEPPAGIREYTSSSRGLRLPDANWYPHFPKSAETMLQFFALGNKRRIAGITSVNVSIGKLILESTGPLWLPDYSTWVSSDNLQNVLREERDEFFPGSLQKKHILSQTVTLARQKVASMPASEQLTLVKKLFSTIPSKDIQIYATNPDLQSRLLQYAVTGELGLHPQITDLTRQQCLQTQDCIPPVLFYLVESNVGINKANHFIQRSVDITPQPDNTITVKVVFTNTAPLETQTLLTPVVGGADNPKLSVAKNGYANYQRLLLGESYRLRTVIINGTPETKIDEEALEYDSVGTLNQYGFLTIVLPSSQTTVELTLEPLDSEINLAELPLLIQRQSGLPTNTTYSLHTSTPPISFLLAKDILLNLK